MKGEAVVTVKAADPAGLSVTQAVEMIVEDPPDPESFNIAIDFKTPIGEKEESFVRQAAERWMSIIIGDLPDVSVTGAVDCDDATRTFTGEIDDIRLSVTVTHKVSNFAGAGGPARVREGSHLPFSGRIWLRSIDSEWRERYFLKTAMHEMAHALGFGFWGHFGYLQNPSRPSQPGADTHFNGPLAIQAFDDAGGTRYTGAKVPLANGGICQLGHALAQSC